MLHVSHITLSMARNSMASSVGESLCLPTNEGCRITWGGKNSDREVGCRRHTVLLRHYKWPRCRGFCYPDSAIALLGQREGVDDLYHETVKPHDNGVQLRPHAGNRQSEAVSSRRWSSCRIYKGGFLIPLDLIQSNLILTSKSPKTLHPRALSSNSPKPIHSSPLSSVGSIHRISSFTSSYLADLLLRINHHHEALRHPFRRHSNHLGPVPEEWWT